MIPTYADISNCFQVWKRVRFYSSLKCDIDYVTGSSWVYPALFISTVIIYAECVFFHGFFTHYYVPPTPLETALRAVVLAFSSPDTYAYILVVYFLAAFGFWAYRLSKGIIIEPFQEDEEKEQKQKSLDGPVHVLLAYELNNILKLYCDVDKTSPIPTTLNVVPTPSVSVRVEDVGEVMGTVVTSESVIKIGQLQIPVSILLSFFGRFLGGRKIQGSLLFSQKEIIIVASMAGGKQSHSWKVRRSRPSSPAGETNKAADPQGGSAAEGPLIREMIEELACRIFSDLTEFQSFHWKATRKFMEGIESYRACLLNPGEKIERFKQAEAAFSEALSLDVTFSSAWYNLGAVYTALKLTDAAKVAFYKSFSSNRTKGEAYYAVALNEYNSYIENPRYGRPAADPEREKNINKLNDALFFCSHAISLQKYNPEVWLLKGRLHLELYYLTDSPRFPPLPGAGPKGKKDSLKDAIAAFWRSVQLSYRLWEKEELSSMPDQIVRRSDGTLTAEQLRHREELRERLGEFGWVYLEYAAREKHAASEIRKSLPDCEETGKKDREEQASIHEQACNDALSTSLAIFYEALFDNPDLVHAPLTKEIINKNISRDVPNALLFWKCGVLQICRGDFASAGLLLGKALVIDPRAFLYQASHILGKTFYDNRKDPGKDTYNTDPEKAKFYWTHALQHALNAYNRDKNDNDYQWGYIAEAAALIGILRFPDLPVSVPPPAGQVTPPVPYSAAPALSGTMSASSALSGTVSAAPATPPGWQNRFTPLVRVYTPAGCKGFGKFILTVFDIFEFLTIRESDEFFNGCSTRQEDSVSKKIMKSDREILDFFKERIKKESETSLSPEGNEILGYLSDHTDWVLALSFLAVYEKLLDKGDAPEALELLEEAQVKLSEYPLEIGHRGVNAVMTKPLRKQKCNREAYTSAWKAHWIDPTSYFEHKYLGDCEFSIADYRNAINHWREEIQLDPQQNLSVSRIATAYLQLSWDYAYDPENPEKCQQNENLQNAQDFLKKLLTIAEHKFQTAPDDKKEEYLDILISVYFWMGRVHLERAEFSDAAIRFRTVKNLAVSCRQVPDKKRESDNLDRFGPSAMYLAIALFSQGKFADAEAELEKILKFPQIAEIADLLTQGNDKQFSELQKKFLTSPCGKKLSVVNFNNQDLITYTFLLLAQIDIARTCPRDIVNDRIIKILILLRKTAPDKPPEQNIPGRSYDTRLMNVYAEIAKISGLYHLKPAFDNEDRNPETAVRSFRKAVCFSGDPESYLFLMMAYHRCLQLKDTPSGEKNILAELDHCCSVLKKAGIPREYTAVYKQITEDRKKWSGTPPPQPPSGTSPAAGGVQECR